MDVKPRHKYGYHHLEDAASAANKAVGHLIDVLRSRVDWNFDGEAAPRELLTDLNNAESTLEWIEELAETASMREGNDD